MNESGTYTTVNTGGQDDFVVTSNSPAEEVQALVHTPEPEAAETTEPVEAVAEETTETAKERDEAGRFKGKKAKDNPIVRMQEATAKEAEAKRERDDARRELEAMRAERAEWQREREARSKPQAPPQAAPPESDGRPDPTDTKKYPDGQYDAKYVEDLADHIAEKRVRAALEGERRQAAQQAEARTWQEKLQAARQATPDFDTRINPETPLDHRVRPYILKQPDGPQILLYLSEHQELAQRLATLHPVEQIGEIGKIQARLERTDAASSRGSVSVPVPSKASAPITPLGGGSPASVDDGSDEESFDKHYQRFQKEARTGRR